LKIKTNSIRKPLVFDPKEGDVLRKFYDTWVETEKNLGTHSILSTSGKKGRKVRLSLDVLWRYAKNDDKAGFYSYYLRQSRRPRKKRHGLVNPHKRKAYTYRCRQMFGHTLELVCGVTYGYNAYPKMLCPKRRK